MGQWFGRRAPTWLLVAVAGVVLFTPSSASSCDLGFRFDGRAVTWCFGTSLDNNPDLRNGAQWAISNLASTTVLTATQVANCSPSVNPHVDVRFVQSDSLGLGVLGHTQCSTGPEHQQCDRFAIQISRATIVDGTDGTIPNNYSDDQVEAGEIYRNIRATWCHELGHAASARHHPADGEFDDRAGYYQSGAGTGDRAQDCLVRGHIEDDSTDNWLRYNTHHVSEIAARH